MVVLVEVGISGVAMEMGRVTLAVGMDCTGEAQAARNTMRRKAHFFIVLCSHQNLNYTFLISFSDQF
jgi:hypothetical protein